MELTARKQKILSAVVESYISDGEPVGSKSLISKAELNVSSATIRNELAELTELGFLIQPHTSAGRIPTRQGYRYYVDNVLRPKPVGQSGMDYIASALSRNAESPESVLQAAASLITELTGLVALATTPDSEEARIRKISFVQTGARSAMAVLIASNGIIKTKLFRCEFLITPEILEVFDKALNEAFAGIRLSSVNQPFIQTAAANFGELSFLMPSALLAIKDAAQLAKEIGVYHSGYNVLLHAGESGFVPARRIMEFLSNTHDLARMLENLPLKTAAVIGPENNRTELAECSVVSSRYLIDSNPSGVLAVIGPLRLDYGRVMSITEAVAETVGDLIGGLIEI